MSKFLLNLLLQISKALVNSKIQFLIRKFIFPDFRPGRPRGPLGLWPSPPLAAPLPAGRKRPAGQSSPCVFLFRSRLPEPAASSLCHRHAGPAYRLHRLHRAGRPWSRFSPRRRSLAPLPRASDAPERLQPSLITSPLLIPFKPSVNGP
jgi:hypothetical protein